MDNLNEKDVVVTNNNELTLLEIWNRLWKNKLIIIIVTAIFVVVGTLALFFYNKSNTIVQNNFNYEFLNVSQDRFPDESVYDYNNLVSSDFLNSVKNRNEKFSNLNIEDLIIKVRKHEDVITLSQNNFTTRTYLQIELNVNQFNNNPDDAELFLKELHQEFLELIKTKNESRRITNYFNIANHFDTYLRNDLDNLTYLEILDLIEKQHVLLSNDIVDFISRYGQVQINGSRISTIQSDYNFWFSNNVNLDQLTLEVIENEYIRSIEATLRNSRSRLSQVNRQIDLNDVIIAELTNLLLQLPFPNEVNDLNVFYREIESRTIQNASLNVEKADLERILLNTENNINYEFDAHIKNLIARQNLSTREYNDFKVDYLNSVTRYTPYDRMLEFEVVKPFNLITMIIILGVIGLSFGSFAVLIKESNDIKK